MSWYRSIKTAANQAEQWAAQLVPEVFQHVKEAPYTSFNLSPTYIPIVDIVFCVSKSDPSESRPLVNAACATKESGQRDLYIQVSLPLNFDQNMYQVLYRQLQDTIRHELEHANTAVETLLEHVMPSVGSNTDLQGLINYWTNPVEVRAFVSGLYYQAKKERRPFTDVVSDYLARIDRNLVLKGNSQKVSTWVISQIFDTWIDYAKERFPAAQL